MYDCNDHVADHELWTKKTFVKSPMKLYEVYSKNEAYQDVEEWARTLRAEGDSTVTNMLDLKTKTIIHHESDDGDDGQFDICNLTKIQADEFVKKSNDPLARCFLPKEMVFMRTFAPSKDYGYVVVALKTKADGKAQIENPILLDASIDSDFQMYLGLLGVKFVFDKAGARKFFKFSTNNSGKKTAIVVNNLIYIYSRNICFSMIKDGHVNVMTHEEDEDAHKILNAIYPINGK